MSRRARSLLAMLLLAATPAAIPVASAAVFISVNFAPPALPVYEQPPCPGPGFLWTPGYWAWGDEGYYWVPGTWVEPPDAGYLWTPGYWGWEDGIYLWHPGYWGLHVGFYGGVNYGFGYTGVGFVGGEWRGRDFYYNSRVVNVVNVHVNVYERPVTVVESHVSFNGGVGGIVARPTAYDTQVASERHVAFTEVQTRHEREAFHNVSLRATTNGGRPAIAATARPGEFSRGVIAAREAGSPHPYTGGPLPGRGPVGGQAAARPGESYGGAGTARPVEPRGAMPAARPSESYGGAGAARPVEPRGAMPAARPSESYGGAGAARPVEPRGAMPAARPSESYRPAEPRGGPPAAARPAESYRPAEPRGGPPPAARPAESYRPAEPRGGPPPAARPAESYRPAEPRGGPPPAARPAESYRPAEPRGGPPPAARPPEGRGGQPAGRPEERKEERGGGRDHERH
jgi:hypothetical protein